MIYNIISKKMKNPTLLLLLFVFSVVGCGDEKVPEPFNADDGYLIISLHELLKSPSKYEGKKVTIAAYYVTHSPDGPWICGENGDWKKRLETTLSIKNAAEAKFVLLDSTRAKILKELGLDRKYELLQDEDLLRFVRGYSPFSKATPALITGTFKVGDYYIVPHDFVMENHPFLELIEVREVRADDPQWKVVQPNRE